MCLRETHCEMAGRWNSVRLVFTKGLCVDYNKPSDFSAIESVSQSVSQSVGCLDIIHQTMVSERYCLPIALLSNFEDGDSRFLRNKVKFCEMKPRHTPGGSHRHDRRIPYKAYRILVWALLRLCILKENACQLERDGVLFRQVVTQGEFICRNIILT
jgi:hypothetical protein